MCTMSSSTDCLHCSMGASENDALIVRPGIKTPTDLQGKTIATPRGSTSHYLLLYFLKILNLERAVTVRMAQPAELADLWRAGAIDGTFVCSPHHQAMKDMFATRTFITGIALENLGAPTAQM